MNYEHITIDEGQVSTLWLDRVNVRNAFNEEMISEIIDALELLSTNPDCRVLHLRGKGPVFSAGADLNWMKKAVNYSYEENLEESLNLSKCLYQIYSFPKPTIAVIHGAAFGGAIGLLSACDFVLSEDETSFSLSEVKLGLIPACISPYVVKRIGEYGARDLMLTGRLIKGPEAKEFGLANFSGTSEELEQHLKNLTDQLLLAGPEALRKCKKLINEVVSSWSLNQAYTRTAQLIAEVRKTNEAQEGMSSFLEKRKPKWS